MMKQMYAVMKLVKSIDVATGGIVGGHSVTIPLTSTIPLKWSPDMVGALPVFSTLEGAQKEAGDKYDIVPMMVPEKDPTKKEKRKA